MVDTKAKRNQYTNLLLPYIVKTNSDD